MALLSLLAGEECLGIGSLSTAYCTAGRVLTSKEDKLSSSLTREAQALLCLVLRQVKPL